MAKDVFHNAVKTALQKDGWIITADPYEISAEQETIVQWL
jgi:XisH protein